MKRLRLFKYFAVVLCIALIAVTLPPRVAVAVTYNEIEAYEKEYAELQKQLDAAKKALSAANATASNAAERLLALKTERDVLEASIAAAEELSLMLSKEIATGEDDVVRRYENIKLRLRELRESGSPTFFEILISAKSVSELIMSLERAASALDADKAQIENLNRDIAELERKKSEQERLIADLAVNEAALKKSIADAEILAAKTNADAAEKKKLEAEITRQNEAAEAEIDRLIAEYEKKYSVPYVSGSFRWPVDSKYTRISDKFGPRINPVTGLPQSNHNGIDIPAPTGSCIYAANGGKVSIAAYSSSFGYYVVINHGNGRSTFYAHNSKLKVKVGDTVKKGDVIALAGSTGISTGPHCHFEYRINNVPQDPLKLTNIDIPSGIYFT